MGEGASPAEGPKSSGGEYCVFRSIEDAGDSRLHLVGGLRRWEIVKGSIFGVEGKGACLLVAGSEEGCLYKSSRPSLHRRDDGL
jgi:hypothetical protein